MRSMANYGAARRFRIVWVFAGLLLLSGCGGGGSDSGNGKNDDNADSAVIDPVKGGMFTSKNGNIVVTVPGGSLAEKLTITAEQVAVTSLPAELGASSASVDLANAVAIKLGPSGTTFRSDQPARIEFKLPDAEVAADAGNGPGMAISMGLLYLLSEDGSVTEPDNVKFELDPASGAVTLAADVGHFSLLVWVPIKDFKIKAFVFGDIIPIQASFPVVVQLEAPAYIAAEMTLTYTDSSVFPVNYINKDDPAPIPTTDPMLLARAYQCGMTPQKGTYRATVNINYINKIITVGNGNMLPTRWLVDKYTFKRKSRKSRGQLEIKGSASLIRKSRGQPA